MIKEKFFQQEGQVAVIVGILIVVLVGMAAFAIDVGSLYEERRHLQTVADSAALAGAQELPEDVAGAEQVAINYAQKHGVSIDSSNIEITNTLTDPAIKDTVIVTPINPGKKTYFAGVLGFDEVVVAAKATAIIATPRDVGNIVPWSVDKEVFDGISYEDEVTLKFSSPQEPGNFACLDLEGSGAADYRDYIINGYDRNLSIGDEIDTEPGNIAKTKDATEYRVEVMGDGWDDFEVIAPGGEVEKRNETQVVIVPVISFEEIDGGKGKDIPIIDFGIFVITGIEGKNPGKAEIKGTFVKKALTNTDGEVIPVEEEGLRVIRLIK